MVDRILVVEDESTLCRNIVRFLERDGFDVTPAGTGQAALDLLSTRHFDVVLSDLRLPDVDGLTVLDRVRSVSPDTVVLIMTAYASVDSAVEALRRGAHDYVLKPLSLADLKQKVEHISEYRRLGRENARLRALLRGTGGSLQALRRGGKAMNALCDTLEKVAASSSNVLVVGESGTGKELVARALHEHSQRAEGPFVTVDVSAMPDALVESYLFGHARGAFPGATEPREGLFRAASGGTLFLDEVGDLPAALQAKLLRAVETKEILPVGSDEGVKVDVRIVTATQRDLGALAREGTFRADLLYRLQVVELRLPPLRERMEDLPQLAEALLAHHARVQRKDVQSIEPDAMAVLAAYRWPGNVRELSNVLERAVMLCEGTSITPLDLPGELGMSAAPPPSLPSSQETAVAAPRPETDADFNLEHAVTRFQRAHFVAALERTRGNREATAKLLGLSPATLYRYLQKLGLRGERAGEG
jgi:DNA-binding NtrC family response regulator